MGGQRQTTPFKYITQFNDYIGFNSTLFGNHKFVEEGEKLFKEGKPSSMGCVRLQPADAEWIYKLPIGISVHVY